MATNAGLLVIRPDETLPMPADREVKFSALTVAGGPVHASSVTLHESESRFTVRLTTCDYGEAGRIRYAYRMKGFEEEWNETRPGDNVVRYTAVPPGDYTLQVCATDELGRWSDNVAELEVCIVPYFYKRFWFYVNMLVLAALGVWVWYRWKVKHYREQRAELERKVGERTHELAVQNQRLEAMAEQVKAVTEEKISFFTNITHEFRTPVTLIHGPIEQALRESDNGRTKAWLKIAERNSGYLLSLVNELMDFRKLDTDKVLVVLPMLGMPSYRNALCRKLGIPSFPTRKVTTEEEYEEALCDMVEYLIRETGRPGYFATGARRPLGNIADKLYNEGLVYKYSECPYDNIAAAKRIEDLYQYGSLHYEKLRGDMAGCESVRCTLRWRLIFKSFPNENSIIITNVELIKISNHYED